ncbi:MAG: PIN domain-containing protein [Armatimonadetes bacterium]|nr:PIN domain-containing protein [Armatimonadota bacterium]
MVVFLDTSAIFALADTNDENHQVAVARFKAALDAGDDFLTHNYVILESLALVQRRLGWEVTRWLLSEVSAFRVRWVDQELHQAALKSFAERRGRISLVDSVSFLVMREAGISHVLGFDDDFVREGFRPYLPEPSR